MALAAGAAIADRTQVVSAAGVSSEQLAARLASQSDVEYAVPDERRHRLAVPNDPFYATRAYNNASAPSSGGPLVGQWYLKPPSAAGTGANSAPASINAEGAWDITTGNPAIVVAVLDTGVRFDHADLQGGNVLPGYDMISDAGIANERRPDAPCRRRRPGRLRSPPPKPTRPAARSTAARPTSAPGDPSNPGKSAREQLLARHADARPDRRGDQQRHRHGQRRPRTSRCCRCACSASAAASTPTSSPGCTGPPGVHVDGVPDNANPARVINLSLGGAGACSSGLHRHDRAAQREGRRRRRRRGQQHRACGRHAGELRRRDRGRRAAPRRHQGRLLRHRAADRAQRARRQLRQHRGRPALPVPDPDHAATRARRRRIRMPTAARSTPTASTPRVGTSFSAPLVAGTVALMLSAQPSIAPSRITALLQSTARPFPTTGGSNGDSSTVPVCTVPARRPTRSTRRSATAPPRPAAPACSTARAAVLAASGEPANGGGGSGGSGGDGGGGALGSFALVGLLAALLALGGRRRSTHSGT